MRYQTLGINGHNTVNLNGRHFVKGNLLMSDLQHCVLLHETFNLMNNSTCALFEVVLPTTCSPSLSGWIKLIDQAKQGLCLDIRCLCLFVCQTLLAIAIQFEIDIISTKSEQIYVIIFFLSPLEWKWQPLCGSFSQFQQTPSVIA